jgi:hypothetical protein
VAARDFRSELVGSFSEGSNGNPTVAMIEAAFRHHGLNWRYINCEVPPENLADAVKGARAMGWRGFNLSIPHKVTVIQHLDGLGESAAIMGAVNCAVNRTACSSARTPTARASSNRFWRWWTPVENHRDVRGGRCGARHRGGAGAGGAKSSRW